MDTWKIISFFLLNYCVCGWSVVKGAKTKPNMVFFSIDDAGRGDFQRFDPKMATPNIEAITQEGLYLDQAYALPSDSPSKAAFFTSRYPHTFGLPLGRYMRNNMSSWVDESLIFLPQEMKKLTYKTHMVGKWQQGYCHPGLTPTARGFDSFYGFYSSAPASYYSHENTEGIYDWIDNNRIDTSAKGTYQTTLLSTRAEKIVDDSNPDEPFFLYLAYGALHAPFEVPENYVTKYCAHVTNEARQTHCAMMAAVDESIGNITAALKKKGIYDNTVIVVLSDNGGPIKRTDVTGSVNYPLRGSKLTLYEGGTRVYGAFKAPKLKQTNTTFNGIIHMVDWLPTLVKLAGGHKKKPRYCHGKNIWRALKKNTESPRTSFIYNINNDDSGLVLKHSAYRMGDWKIIYGLAGAKSKSGWNPPDDVENWGLGDAVMDPNGELYNLKEDPYEKKNVFADNPEIVEKFSTLIKKFSRKYPSLVKPMAPETDKNRDNDGNIQSCWCQPTGLPENLDAPLDCPYPKVSA